MSLKKSFQALLVACLSIALFSQVGCVPTDLNLTDDVIDTTDDTNTGTDQQTQAPADAQAPVLTITSLLNDTTVSQGQPVLLTWQIQNLPASPTIDVLYRSTTEQTDKVLISNLTTSNVGSLQIDTYKLVPGLKYYITLSLKSSGSVVNTTQATGRIIVGFSKVTIASPLNDTILQPSSLMTINWTGQYLPSDATIQAFFDVDTTYNNGNEVIVKTDSLSAGGSQGAGSITLNATNLWNNTDLKRSLPYYFGIRIIKNGQIAVASYAAATVKLYGGEGFNITSPLVNQPIRPGDTVNVGWTTSSVPNNLTVKIFLSDRSNGSEVLMPGTFKVTEGGTTLNTASLAPNHTFDIMLKLLENDTVIAVRKASGPITTVTTGSSIIINNAELSDNTQFVCLGLENTYTITWATVSTPLNSKVILFLDEDGDKTTTVDQIEITPTDGVDATLNAFDFTPSIADFNGFSGRKFFVMADLVASTGDLYAQDISEGKIRIGHGGIEFTAPTTDVDLLMGDSTPITWANTGDICTKFAGRQKTIRLYVDENPNYLSGRSIEITPVGGLDTCAVQTFTFNPSKLETPLNGDVEYYVIARLTVEGSTEDETQVVALGRISVSQVTLTVLTPSVDVISNFNNIPVTWEIEGLNTTGKKVIFVAVDSQGVEKEISSEYDADAESGTLDASKLPPDTYTIRGKAIGTADNGATVVFATGNAAGRIVLPDGYIDVYYLSDMSNASNDPDLGAPIDGTIFNGYVLGDGVGYEVAPLGDIGGPDSSIGMADFIIFSRYGKIHNSNQPGAGYLIYGKQNFPAAINLNQVAAVASGSPVDGTIIRFPMENAADPDSDTSGTQGRYFVTPIPDVSGDGDADVMVSCLEAAPLVFRYVNITPGLNAEGVPIAGKTMTLTDHRGLSRAIAPGDLTVNPYDTLSGHTEIAHVKDYFILENFSMESTPFKLYYGVAQDIGNGQTYAGRFTLHYLAAASGHYYFKPGSVITITANPILKDDLSDIDHYDITCEVQQPGSLEIEYNNITPRADADGNLLAGKKMEVTADYFADPLTPYVLVPSAVAEKVVQKTDLFALPDSGTIKITVTMEGGTPVVFDLTEDLTTVDSGLYSAGTTKYKPGSTILIQAVPTYDSNDTPTAVTGYNVICYIGQPYSNPFNRRGVCYLLTSDRLKNYNNTFFDMVNVGEYKTYDANLTGAARDQMLTADDTGTTFGTGVAVVPNLGGGSAQEMIIANPYPEVTDTLGDFTSRDEAGHAFMFDLGTRFSSLDTNIYAMNFTSSDFTWSDQVLAPWRVNFIGNEDDAHLTSVAMLGKRRSLSNFGSQVLGDFNGDDAYDVIFGAPGEGSDKGAIYILPLDRFYDYHIPMIGRDIPLMDLDDLNKLIAPGLTLENPIQGFKITSTGTDKLGEIVKAIGDFNGDNLSDFVVALPEKSSSDNSKAQVGRIAIIFGKANVPPSTINIDTITSAEVGRTGLNALIFEGQAVGDKLGTRICGVQDVNGDGYDDILVAAPNADNGATANCGKVYLIYGRSNIVKTNAATQGTYIDYDADGAADDIHAISEIGTTISGATFVGEAANDKLEAISPAGDVNGDGIGDILIGSRFADVVTSSGVTHENAGRAYLILGRPFTWPTN
jgi:hypothetical protein